MCVFVFVCVHARKSFSIIDNDDSDQSNSNNINDNNVKQSLNKHYLETITFAPFS